MLISFFSKNRFPFWKNRFFFDYRIDADRGGGLHSWHRPGSQVEIWLSIASRPALSPTANNHISASITHQMDAAILKK